jgi:UTP--glucose-1-phosphate uridylyltransferase
MLPVARKPIVQYVAEELVANGLTDILFVTGRDKTSIENHFDSDPELTRQLNNTNKLDLLREVDFEYLNAHFFYTRQRMQKGLGDAVLCGENFAGDQPFAVALGDSILGINAQSRCLSRMIELFEKHQPDCVVAVEEVSEEEVSQYGIVSPSGSEADAILVGDLVEKPTPDEAPSNLAIAGRYVFSPRIFKLIREVKPGKGGEIQLTDAMRMLCRNGSRVFACKLPPGEKRYDIGNFPSYFETFVEFALADPVHGAQFRRVLHKMLKKS